MMPSERSSTPTCLPKPCLKQLGKVCPSQQKHAHFPPPSEEAKRYSGLDYDRSPIVVLVNECALPKRGERTLDDIDMPKPRRHHTYHSKESRSMRSTSDAHDHTTLTIGNFIESLSYTLPTKSRPMPSLVHGDSSDSDDGVALPIDDRGLRFYRHELAPDSNENLRTGAANAAFQSRRLRKSPPAHAHGRTASSHETRNSSTENFSAFAPWSGNNTCLGGF